MTLITVPIETATVLLEAATIYGMADPRSGDLIQELAGAYLPIAFAQTVEDPTADDIGMPLDVLKGFTIAAWGWRELVLISDALTSERAASPAWTALLTALDAAHDLLREAGVTDVPGMNDD